MNRLLVWFALLIFTHAALSADIVVYDDSTHAGFDQSCTFGGASSDFDFANNAPAHAGSLHSIRFTPDQFNAVSWCKSSGPVSATTDFPSITFWVYLTSSAQGRNIDLVLNLHTSTSYYPASLESIYGSPIPAGTWVQLHTVFATGPIGYGGMFDHISLQDETGLVASDTVFRAGFDAPLPEVNAYFDDVVLQSKATTTYTVTAGASGSGSISPASQIVPSGTSASFTLTPNAGYHVVSVTGDHCTIAQQGVTTTWISSAITQNCAVTATFAINKYTVTANAPGGNGTITPASQSVNSGSSASFVVTPSPSYYAAVSGDTCTVAQQGVTTTWTSSAIAVDCAVTATFAPTLPPPSCGMTDQHDVSVIPAAGDTMISDVFSWCDSAGNPRAAVLAHNDQTGKQAAGGYPNHGGSLQQFSYQMPDTSTRTATITTYGNGGYGGFGYVVSHSADSHCAGDDSPLGYAFTGTWTRVFEGRHHAIFRFQQNYQRHCGPNPSPPTTLIPVTIDWVFSTGRDNPVWAITYDLSSATKSDHTAIAADFLYDDSRAPYGELNIDGNGFSHDIDGVAWGDKYKFTSTTAPVTLSSAWTWNVANTIPYVKEWIVASDATMGLVQTQTMSQQDAGGGRNPYYRDLTPFWGATSAAGNACTDLGYSMPCQDGWPYQANNDSIGTSPNSNNNARLTWGTQYGFLGQTTYPSNQTTAPDPDNGPHLPGWPKKSYSIYVVLGPHSTTPVETQVTQVETVQTLTLTASTGSVATSGPAGVNRPVGPSDTVTYAPAGYDQIYGALAFNASAGNALDANIAVGSGTLKNALIIVRGYASAAYPTAVKVNGTTLAIDVDYFPSLRNTASELWITLNSDLTGATNHLEVIP